MTEKDLIIQDLRRENAELRARVPKWISVDDRLPEAGVAVLARCFYHENWRTLVCSVSKSNVGQWYTFVAWRWVQVTHWMPVPPEPPKGE